MVNYEEAGNEHFAADYKLAAPCVVLVRIRGETPVEWRSLPEVWKLAEDRPAPARLVQQNVQEFLDYVAIPGGMLQLNIAGVNINQTTRTIMASKVNRRRFLKSAATGIVAGAAAQAAGSVLAAENPPTSGLIPLPDAQTKPAVAGTAPQPICGGAAAQVIFACSGSADVGKIADLAARKLTEQGAGKMSCLAGVGGRVRNHGNDPGRSVDSGH